MVEFKKENMLQELINSPYRGVGVLMFASKMRYGGGYKNHSNAQEEYFLNHTHSVIFIKFNA